MAVSEPEDIDRYRKRLRPIEQEAKGQHWAKERPWKATTHVWWEQGVPVVDLHDLKAALARDAIRAVLEAPPAAGAVVFIHGRGRHSAGVRVLQGVVHKELARACAEVGPWSFRPLGSARTVWISDRRLAPDWAIGRWGPLVWLAWLALLAAAALALAHALGIV